MPASSMKPMGCGRVGRAQLVVGVALAAMVCVSTAGCTGSRTVSGPRDRSPISTAPELSTTSPPSSSGRLSVKTLVRLKLSGQRSVAALRIFGHYLSWVACTGCSERGQADQLFVADLSQRTVGAVAGTRWPHGTIDWTAGTDEFVAWDDVSRVPSDLHPRVAWTIHAMDLRTRRRWVVASSHGHLTKFIPLLHANAGRLVWVAPDPDGRTSDLVVDALRSRRTAIVKRQVLAFDARLWNRWVVYDDDWPPGRPGANLESPPKHREVYAVPVSGGPAIDLGGHHQANAPGVGSGYVVWGEPMYGDQQTIWVRRLSGGPARLVYRGGNVQREVGRAFVALWPNVGPLKVVPVHPGADPGPPVVIDGGQPIYVPAHFAVSGNRLAHATVEHQDDIAPLITVEVDQIQPSHPTQ